MTNTPDELRQQAAALIAQADQLAATQFTAADLAGMDHQEISDARAAGRLDRLLGVPDDEINLRARATAGRIDIEDVRALTALNRHDLIDAARAEDRIDYPNQEN